jgi:hypothetical protein
MSALQNRAARRIVVLTRGPSSRCAVLRIGYSHRATGDAPMNLTISGHHLEVTPALRAYVVNKLERITRHFDQVVDIRVLLKLDNQKE